MVVADVTADARAQAQARSPLISVGAPNDLPERSLSADLSIEFFPAANRLQNCEVVCLERADPKVSIPEKQNP